MEQLVVLLVIAAISFVNWLIQKSAEQRAKRRREAGAPEPSELVGNDEDPGQWQAPNEDLRKFMEALGLPADETPPVAHPAQTWHPPEADEPPPLPPLPAAPVATFQAPKFVAPSEDLRRLARRLEAQGETVQAHAIGSSSRVREMLRSPQGMRDAMILSEILSPPKSMQSF